MIFTPFSSPLVLNLSSPVSSLYERYSVVKLVNCPIESGITPDISCTGKIHRVG